MVSIPRRCKAFTLETPELQLFDIIVTAEEDEDPPGTVVARYASTQNVAQSTS